MIDVVPTIYELAKITPPLVVNGFEQDPLDGVSMVYSLGDPQAPGTHHTQFFDIMASRGIYQDGWFASARGPREPWVGGIPPGIREWSDALKQVATLADSKAGADAAGFKRWLAALAERVAQASKEGGFLGIGGTRVSEQETTALRDIGVALGLSA